MRPPMYSPRHATRAPLVLSALSALFAVAACAPPAGAPDAATDAMIDGAATDATEREDAMIDGLVMDAPASEAGERDGQAPLDASATDANASDGPAQDAATDAAITEGSLVPVAHPREFRAVWVATVYNLTYPTSSTLSTAALRSELQALVDMAVNTGLNAIVFQIRPESDAVYRSSIEPWSRFLTGTQGRDPGLDPLETLITLAHARAIEVHAWMNPYRGAADTRFTTASNSVTRTLAAHAVRYNNAIVMDPGSPEVRAHIVRVVRDVATRYALDGVHFDDYFYPYPDAMGTPFPDDARYETYRAGGGTLAKADWRRDNVNRMIAETSEAARAARPSVRFGVSPFGIYRPGMPAGIVGLDAYNVISCDPLAWVRAGSVDYLTPQLYWPTTQTAQSYNTLLPWWAEQTRGRAYLFAGNDITRLGTGAWTVDELRAQLRTTRANRDRGALGNVFFQGRQLLRDTLGIASTLRREFYASPALPPPILAARGTVAPPEATGSMGAIALRHASPDALRAYALYRLNPSTRAWALDRIIPSSMSSPTGLPAGRWAVSAVARDDRESAGRVVDVR
jgi:uncharacterized lipoprotein YddW (UPF0748 family)